MLYDRLKFNKLMINPHIEVAEARRWIKGAEPVWKLSHKFVLGNEFIKLAESFLFEDLSRKYADYSPIKKLKDLSKLPFKHTWFEYPEYYNFDVIGTSGLMISHNEKDDFFLVSQFMEGNGPGRTQIFMNLFRYHAPSLDEEENVLIFQGSTLMSSGDSGNIIAPVIAQVTCILALLNSPAICEKNDHVHDPKVNKRRTQMGKKFLHDYSVLDIKKSVRDAMKQTGDDSHEGRRLHWKRGHFKQRKTGLFWWNAHLAGRKELGFHEKDYKL